MRLRIHRKGKIFFTKASCVADTTFTSGCPIKRSKEQTCLIDSGAAKLLNEEFGANSRCFVWAKQDFTQGLIN